MRLVTYVLYVTHLGSRTGSELLMDGMEPEDLTQYAEAEAEPLDTTMPLLDAKPECFDPQRAP